METVTIDIFQIVEIQPVFSQWVRDPVECHVLIHIGQENAHNQIKLFFRLT